MAEDIYFSSKKPVREKPRQQASYTEKIDTEALERKPGETNIGDIVTENGKISSAVSRAPSQKNPGSRKTGK